MKLAVLAENTTLREDLKSEHGLSLYLEACGKRILFDAGQTGAFADNAEKMGIGLEKVDLAILSHGHYDHGGGLCRFLEINHTAPIYLSRHAFGAHFNGTEKYIGLDPSLRNTDRLIFTEDTVTLSPGLTLSACLDREPVFPVKSFGLNIRHNDRFSPDSFRHEHYLIIEEAGKRYCVSGCSHRGALNLLRWFSPDVLIGGFHFMKLDPEGEGADALRDAAEVLLAHHGDYYTGHCTGQPQFRFLKEILGQRLYSLSTGACFTL
ncbi:MAG: MBL fold metallo-hydrolase [Oscillospiraceae bacterium]|nr:MBL fold metallo-hydrolase [Oscillospiraceae bacterium]MBR2890704.1 MBL fold metallo-hydrolase [Oscillospiraceae bacterium]